MFLIYIQVISLHFSNRAKSAIHRVLCVVIIDLLKEKKKMKIEYNNKSKETGFKELVVMYKYLVEVTKTQNINNLK